MRRTSSARGTPTFTRQVHKSVPLCCLRDACRVGPLIQFTLAASDFHSEIMRLACRVASLCYSFRLLLLRCHSTFTRCYSRLSAEPLPSQISLLGALKKGAKISQRKTIDPFTMTDSTQSISVASTVICGNVSYFIRSRVEVSSLIVPPQPYIT